MSERSVDKLGSLEIDLARRIDAICRRYEAEWRQGRRPRIEDYLGDVPDEVQGVLRAELDALERELSLPEGTTSGRPTGPISAGEAPESPTVADAPTIAPAGSPTPIQDEATLPPRDEVTVDLGPADRPRPESLPPERIRYFGDYEIVRELARGGMGVVFRARQVSLNRTVALKMILAGQLANEAEVRRFYIEAEAAANLDHPGIVPIFEVGQHEGQHYFSMGFIEGQSLSQRLADGPLPAREAAELIRRVSEAIEYAHRCGVIHRDLKPANILLDREGNPRVTDFGLAKKIEGDSGLTGSGQIMGTPSYMPPEQVGGPRGEVGPAADVYALGATLYALVTGRPPFQAATPMDTVIQVVSDEPVPPRRLNVSIPLDVETICLKCLEKAPSRRYPSAAALADDLGRYLAGEPIVARPVTRVERAVKWARRRPAVAGLLALVILSTALGLGGSISGWLRASSALAQSELNLHINRIALAGREWEAGNAPSANAILDECQPVQRGWEWHYTKRLCNVDLLRFPVEGLLDVAVSADATRIATERRRISADGRQLFIVSIRDTATGQEIQTRSTFATGIARDPGSTRFTPDLKGLATVISGDRTRRVWTWLPAGRTPAAVYSTSGSPHTAPAAFRFLNLETGREVKLRVDPRGKSAAACSPDASRLAVVQWDVLVPTAPGRPGEPAVPYREPGTPRATTVETWDATSGRRSVELRGQAGWVDDVVFGTDPGRLATINRVQDGPRGWKGLIQVWDTTTGREIAPLGPPQQMRETKVNPGQVAFSLDDRLVHAVSRDFTRATGRQLLVDTWQVSNGVHLGTVGIDERSARIALSPDGSRLVAAGSSRGSTSVIHIYDTGTGRELRTMPGPSDGTDHVESSPDRLEHPGPPPPPPVGGTVHVEFSPDGRRFILINRGQGLVVHDLVGEAQPRILRGHSGSIQRASFSDDSSRLATAGSDGTVRIWDLESGRGLLIGLSNADMALSFSQDGRRLVGASGTRAASGEVSVWDVSPDRGVRRIADRGAGIVDLVYCRDGSRITAIREDGEIVIRDVVPTPERSESKAAAIPHSERKAAPHYALSPDGDRVAISSPMSVKIRATSDGREVATLDGFGGPSVTFSPDGLYVTAMDRGETRVIVCDAASGQLRLKCEAYAGDPEAPVALNFSPDGTRLVAVMPGGMLAVWDAATGHKLVAVKLPGQPTGSGTSGVALSRDGSRLIVPVTPPNAPPGQGAVLVLNARNGAELLRIGTGTVTAVAFSGDVRRLFSGGGDQVNGEVRVWDLDSGREMLSFREPGGRISCLAVDPGGDRLAAGDTGGGLRSWDARPLPATTGLVIQAASPTFQARLTERMKRAFSYPDGRVNWRSTLIWTALALLLCRFAFRGMRSLSRRRSAPIKSHDRIGPETESIAAG